MTLRTALFVTVLAASGVACASPSSPTPEPAAQMAETTTTTTVMAAPSSTTTTTAGFNAQAYCVEELGALAVKYPKSLGGSNLASECSKMLRETDATSAKTIDALLEVSEGYYKMVG